MTLQEFRIPDVGEGLAEIEIVHWLVQVDDRVTEHQVLVTVETDKSVIEMPSPFTGTVRELHGKPGDRMAVGAVLAVFESDDDGATAPSAPVEAASTPGESTPGATTAAESSAAASPGVAGRRRASPTVRRLARELSIELASVTPTGRGSLVTAEDVRAAADGRVASASAASISAASTAVTAATVPVPVPVDVGSREVQVLPLRGLRRTIARNMSAVALVPHITSHREVDATALLEWRRRVNARRPRAPFTITPFLAMCVIGALRAVPRLNATFDPEAEEVTIHKAVHLGVAAATDDGLLVPVVHDADLRDLADLSAEIEALAAGARERSLRPEQMSGGTFTITNYGSRGGWFGTPLLRAPEIGIAGFGRAAPRPWVDADGELTVAHVLPLSIAVDHRIIDGDLAAQFGGALADIISDPWRLMEGGSPWS